MFCSNCGKKVAEGANFCKKCGAKIIKPGEFITPSEDVQPVEVQQVEEIQPAEVQSPVEAQVIEEIQPAEEQSTVEVQVIEDAQPVEEQSVEELQNIEVAEDSEEPQASEQPSAGITEQDNTSEEKPASTDICVDENTQIVELERIANCGYVEAIEEYIDRVITGKETDYKVVLKAKRYAKILKKQAAGENKARYKELHKKVVRIEKKKQKERDGALWLRIACVFMVFGSIYLFKGLNEAFFKEMLPTLSIYIPEIPESFIIRWSGLESFMKQYMSMQGLFGSYVILFACFIAGLSCKPAYVHKKSIIAWPIVGGIVALGIYVMNFVINYQETSKVLGYKGIMQIVVLVVPVVIGTLIGIAARPVIDKLTHVKED